MKKKTFDEGITPEMLKKMDPETRKAVKALIEKVEDVETELAYRRKLLQLQMKKALDKAIKD